MRNRVLSILMTLSFVVAGLVTFGSSSPAQATTNWSTTLTGVTPINLYAYSNGGVVAAPCSANFTTSNVATYVDGSGVVRSTVPKVSSGGQPCVTSYGAEDGTVYGWDYVNATWSAGSTSRLTAWKNGRQLWATNTTSPANCNTYGSTTEGMMIPSSISQGDDGNVYLILTPMVAPQTCPDRLVGLNPATGVLLFSISLGFGPAPGSGLGGATPTAWTYDDAIVVVDRNGKVREFSYAGLENTSAAYQFPMPTGHKIKSLASNDAGTIFAMTETVYSYTELTPVLLYHKRSGGNGSIVDTNASITDVGSIQPTHDGSVVAIGYSSGARRLDYFNLTTGLVASPVYPTPVATSGYGMNGLVTYLEDEDGNKVYAWDHYDSTTGNSARSIEVYDATTTVTSRVYLRETKPDDSTNYPPFYVMNGMSSVSTANGVTYLAVCNGTYSTCATTTATPTTILEAVDLNNFGLPLGKDFKRNNYESDKLEYVAMGDSFSSGEGNPGFNLWTDSVSNKCHRSEQYAYPTLLGNDSDLDLELVDFVACSGATTASVLYGDLGPGNWNEGPQVDVLTSQTDVVSITIGGNDAGFQEYVEGCVINPCGPLTITYSAVMDLIGSSSFQNNLETTYEEILDQAPGADVYVLDYPYLSPEEILYCGVVDLSGGRSIQVALNTAIAEAVASVKGESTDYNNRLNYVPTNEEGSPFEGAYLCNGDPDNLAFGLVTFHPNVTGHVNYEEVLSTYMTE